MSAVAHRPRESPVRRSFNTLVLNADYRPLSSWPLSLIPARDAVEAAYRDRVEVVESWDAVFRSPSTEIRIPKVVALRHYAAVGGEPKFCRRSILLRDRFRCQYCGQAFAPSELTFDHVTPRSQGGRTTWDNILTACLRCNGLKADKAANHSGRKGVIRPDGRLRPLKQPKRPSSAELMRAGLECLPQDLAADFGSWLYWTVELQT